MDTPSKAQLSDKLMVWSFWAIYHSVFFFLARWVHKEAKPLGTWQIWQMVTGLLLGLVIMVYGWRRFQTKRKIAKDFVNAYTEVLNVTFLMLVWFMFLFLLNWPPLPFLIFFWLVHTSLAPTPILLKQLAILDE